MGTGESVCIRRRQIGVRVVVECVGRRMEDGRWFGLYLSVADGVRWLWLIGEMKIVEIVDIFHFF